MALEIKVDGPALIKVGTGASGALEQLGYTENGTDVEFRGYHGDVPGDEHGGDQGPPIDVQYFGEIVIVRLTFTKFDVAIANKVSARVRGATFGTPATPGTLMFDSDNCFRLLIQPTRDPLNFLRAFSRGSITTNKGTKFSRYTMEFECHKDGTGKLFDGVTT